MSVESVASGDGHGRGAVGIVGTGLVGSGWAVVFARAGHPVRMYDVDPAAAEHGASAARRAIADLADNDLLGGQDADAVAALVEPSTDLASAVGDAAYVQECVPEVAELKAATLQQVAEVAPPGAVLASSTSSIVPSRFTADVPHRERCVVAHPFNPPHLHTCVELVPAPWTSAETMARTRTLLEAAGMEPVSLAVEMDGFLVNHIQGAVLQECFRLVASGAVSAADVDRAVRGALAPRWSFMGPFETIDLNAPGGIRDYVARYEALYARLDDARTPRVDWAAVVDDGLEAARAAELPREQLAERRAWRDRNLMAFVRHRSRPPEG